jgi:hypothetical protein
MGKSTHFLSKVISYLQKKLSKIETTKKFIACGCILYFTKVFEAKYTQRFFILDEN